MSPQKKPPLSHRVGKKGEIAALTHLKRQGVSIIDKNVRLGHYEIDIIGWEKEELLIIEVKASARELLPSVEGFVLKQQQQNLVAASANYLEKNNLQAASIRYDLILVSYALVNPMISYIKNAFHPFLI